MFLSPIYFKPNGSDHLNYFARSGFVREICEAPAYNCWQLKMAEAKVTMMEGERG